MRSRKIRGHKRRWNDIEKWINNHKDLNLDYLKDYKRDYAKIRVHPWSGLALTNSTIPEPKRETRKRITSGLIEIYDSWKITLDKLGEPYYLKICGYNGSKCATHFGQNVPLEVARFAQSRAQLASSVPFRLVPVFPFRLMPILCAHFTPKISV